jgi:hypothetical protein
MSINVNKITSVLAKLQDPQLQQYAQLHKNDPYIMALAMSESNRRKELRAASQAPAQQEQPKVVDSEIAQMAPQQLPEDQGIGQLNAGDMNFADGGIIAFAGGGDVERFNGTQSQFVQDVAGIPGMYDKWWQANRESDKVKAEREKEMEQRRQDELAARQKTSFANYLFGSPEREAAGKAELAQLATTPVGAPARSGTMPEPGYTRPGMLYDPRLNTPPTQPVVAAPKVDTTRKVPGAGPSAAPTAAAGPQATPASGPTDIDALQQKYFGAIDQEVGGLKNARAGLVAGIKDLAEQNLAATKADIEKRGDVYKGREERLAKQEKGLEGMGDRNMGLALLQAGAAMMSTPGGLGVALGKGVQIGSERYAAGLDKIEAAKSKFAEARDRLDDLRINRDDMNTKEIRAAEKDARESELKGKELLYNGLVSDLGIKQKNVTAIFGAAAGALENDKRIASSEKIAAGQERGANARAGRNQQLEVLQAVSKDPTLAAAYKSMHGKGEDVMGQYNEFLKANPTLALDPKQAMTQFLMSKSVFSQLGAPVVTDKAAGPLRKQP